MADLCVKIIRRRFSAANSKKAVGLDLGRQGRHSAASPGTA